MFSSPPTNNAEGFWSAGDSFIYLGVGWGVHAEAELIRTQREKSPTQAALQSRRWPIKIDPFMLHDTETLLFQPSHYLGT